MTIDAETVRSKLTALTGAAFVVSEPGPNRMLVKKNARWFVTYADLADVEKTGHLSAAWLDKEGALWFETSEITDMTRLVEKQYGEKGATSMPVPEKGIPPEQSIPEEVTGFPSVVKLLKEYEEITARVVGDSGAKLLYDGGDGVTSVRIAIPTTNYREENEISNVIEFVSGFLKRAYDAVLEVRE